MGRREHCAPSPSTAGYSHPSKSKHPLERYTMNESRTRTGRIFERLVAIWQDTRYASQRLTAINRPWIGERASELIALPREEARQASDCVFVGAWGGTRSVIEVSAILAAG